MMFKNAKLNGKLNVTCAIDDFRVIRIVTEGLGDVFT